MIMADRSLDRSKMRALVFADPAAKRRLEAILHPLIEQYALAALRAAPGPYAIYMVPLWIEKAPGESGPDRRRIEAAAVVVVDCEEKVQVSRVIQRSQLPEAQVLAIMAAQARREDRIRAATHILNNDGSADDLQDQVDTLHRANSFIIRG
jgi:dephospho-CoA kinase